MRSRSSSTSRIPMSPSPSSSSMSRSRRRRRRSRWAGSISSSSVVREGALGLGDGHLALQVLGHARAGARTAAASSRRATRSSGGSGRVEAIRSASRPGVGRLWTKALPVVRDSRRADRSRGGRGRSPDARSRRAPNSRVRSRRGGRSAAGSNRHRAAGPRVRAMPTTMACFPSRFASITRTMRTMHPDRVEVVEGRLLGGGVALGGDDQESPRRRRPRGPPTTPHGRWRAAP